MCGERNIQSLTGTIASLWLTLAVTATASAATPRTVRFQLRPSRIGDRLAQDVQFNLSMQTSSIRDGKQADNESTEFTRRQRRMVTARQIRAGRVVQADVTFVEAEITFQEGEQPVRKVVQPIAGKSYVVTREADPAAGGALTITDAAGQIPPIDEFEIVLQSMDAIGRSNPLAEFLAGRQVSIGQTLSLPKEVAISLLGAAEQPGEITRFDLTLRHIQVASGHSTAVFDVRGDARSPSSVQMGLLMEGQMIVETDTCRTLVAHLTGPISMSESQGPMGAQTAVTGRGKIAIAITSQYARQ